MLYYSSRPSWKHLALLLDKAIDCAILPPSVREVLQLIHHCRENTGKWKCRERRRVASSHSLAVPCSSPS